MPSRASLRRSIWLTAAGFALLAAVIAVTFWMAGRQQQEQEWVSHSLEVRNQLTRLFARMQDAENGQRGYLITGDETYLEPYENALKQLEPQLGELAGLITDNPAQQDSLAKLRPLIDERMAVIASSIEKRKAGDAEGAMAVVQGGRGKVLMDQIRTGVRAMVAEEERLLAERRTSVAATNDELRWAIIAGFALILVLTVFAIRDARHRLAETAAARDLLAEANAKLHAEATSRALAEGQLRHAQKMESLGQLTGGIAHDFNNMLAIIVGSLDLVNRRLRSDPDRAQQGVKNAMEGAQRAAALTARLLAFSRQQALSPSVCEPNKVVAGMSELLRRSLGERIEIETVLAGGLWRTFADSAQIETAILNLAVNARDAMANGGKLTIETENAFLDEAYAAENNEVAPGQYVAICVTDTGSGMDEATIERAFDPFFTTKGVGHGTGLGLSQVFGFVKQSRGHVKIYSELGRGTTVKLYLPRFTGTAPAAAEKPPVAMAQGSETILVVEDEANVRRVTVDTLRELGYTVVHAANGSEALGKLDAMPHIDLLFTDVVMPEMTGRALADEAVKRRPELKVLYATGYTRNAVVHNGMLDAGVAFMTKPFTMDQLAQKVRAVLDGGGINRPA